jgi:hypothetical protein
MSTLRSLYHVARADYLQRTRSQRFLAVLVLAASMGYLVNTSGLELVYTRQLGTFDYEFYYGRSTAAWVGAKTALAGSFFLLFAGFYVLKNTLARERHTGMDTLVSSMATTDRLYLLGKWLSNIAVVFTILAVLGAASVIIHAVNGVGTTRIVPLIWPLLLLAAPLGFVLSGVALLFETIDVLSGSIGNAVYFLGAIVAANMAFSAPVSGGTVSTVVAYTEPIGYAAVYAATYDALTATVQGYSSGVPVFGSVSGGTEYTFTWAGGGWPVWMYLKSLFFLTVGAGLTAVGTVTFDRFTAADRSLFSWSRLPIGGTETNADLDTESDTATNPEQDSAADTDVTELVGSLTPVGDRDAGGIWRVVIAEARMTVAGRRRLWYVGGALVILLGLFGGELGEFLLPVALLWPVFLLSELGIRTRKHQTRELVVSSSHPVGQLAAEWIVGATVLAILVGSTVIVPIIGGDTAALLGYVTTIVFVPSLALGLGTLTGTGRAFEGLYLLLWYIGPVNGAAVFNFAAPSEGSSIIPLIVFAAIGIVSLAAGLFQRSRRSS